jgi:glycine cleavage system H protein
MTFPEDLRYTPTHEWVRLEGNILTIGITDHAQTELGDIVYLDLPAPGRAVDADEAVAVIESVKAASDIYAPVIGEITEVNEAAAANTSLVNSDPYGQGWLFKMKVGNPNIIASLFNATVYRSLTGNK